MSPSIFQQLIQRTTTAGETTSLRDDLIKHDENVVANVLLDINKHMENENEQEAALEKNIDAEFEKTKEIGRASCRERV